MKRKYSYSKTNKTESKYNWRKHVKTNRERIEPVDMTAVMNGLDRLEGALLIGLEATNEITREDVSYNIGLLKRVLSNNSNILR
jgi:hypothetical protein